ncbi:MAG: OmpA family protein [Bacteroidetes bacterium]|nr:OmpA family protein [Bacteroidota bacterium]
MAEAMYTGTNFLAGKNNVIFVPVFVNSVTNQKSSIRFENAVTVPMLRNLDQSNYNVFRFKETDFPVLVAYKGNNELCGIAQHADSLPQIPCLNADNDGRFLRLKVLTEDKDAKKTPYANKKVYILNGTKTTTLSIVFTNTYGDFDYKVLDENQDYVLKIPDNVEDADFVILATQQGREIGKFNRTEDGFEYRLLKVEMAKLPDLAPEEDVDIKFTQLKKQDDKDFTITENLFYELGKSDLLPGSKELLDKLIIVLKRNHKYNLVVISHTDSQGDDEANMKLSESRSNAVIEYFISKGVNKKILKGVGKGETEIRNRCTNGVECSDKEHEYNRRTEFRFIKN